MRKVIYVSYMHLSDKVSRDWYIDYLIAKGVTVEYWDVVSLLAGEVVEFGAIDTDYLRTPRTYSEVEAMLRLPGNRDAFYVMLIYYDGNVTGLYRLLTKYDCKMLFIAWGALPIKRAKKMLSIFSNPFQIAEKVFFKIKAIVYIRLGLVKPFNVVFAAGQALTTRNLHASKVIPINLVDYDHYIKAKLEGERPVVGKYAVFLDIYLPYQSDLKIVGMHAVNPGAYYASLNRFFELLEVQYGIKVVVAAHPKADYSVDLFNGREIYYSRTPSLVKDADFVISHHSTSLSYAVLNHKPIIFIYTNEMAALYRHTVVSYLRDFSCYLDAAIHNIDEITNGEKIIVNDVNLSRYDDYKYEFLTTHESENSLTQDIFFREISLS